MYRLISRKHRDDGLEDNTLHFLTNYPLIVESAEDLDIIQSLKETVSKQRYQIKGLQREVKEKESDIETVSDVSLLDFSVPADIVPLL